MPIDDKISYYAFMDNKFIEIKLKNFPFLKGSEIEKIKTELNSDSDLILLLEKMDDDEPLLTDRTKQETWYQFDDYRHMHTNYELLTEYNNYNEIVEIYINAIIIIYPEWKEIALIWKNLKIKGADK